MLDPAVAAHVRSGYRRHHRSDSAADAALGALLHALSRPPRATTLRCSGSPDSAAAELSRALGAAGSGVRVAVHGAVRDCIEITRRCAEGEEEAEAAQEPLPTVFVTSRCGESVLRGADVYRPGLLGGTHHPRCNMDPDGVVGPADLDTALQCSCFAAGARVAVVAVVRGRSTGGITADDRRFVGIGRLPREHDQSAPRGVRAPLCCPVQRSYWDIPAHPTRRVAVAMISRRFNTAPPIAVATLPPEWQQRLFAQNLPCIACSLVVDPKPGETVVDLCAGPGGKASHLGQLMANRGRVWALDASAQRAAAVETLCSRLGVTNVRARHLDARELGTAVTRAVLEGSGLEGADTEGWADRCLVDPPCSGLGDRPRFRQGKTLQAVNALIPHQRKLVEAAVRVLKRPGGVMVYSTCTVNVDENEGQTRWILDSFPHLQLAPQVPLLHGVYSEPGLRGNGLSDEECALVQRFDPQGPGDTVGFYIAKFTTT